MGARATRIVREEFLTPPEFQGLALARSQAARIGGARIELIPHEGETRLGSCYQQVPIRLMPPFVVDEERASLLYLINLTAGLMDGDGHLVQLTARQGTNSVVTGQSATRIHPAVDSFCTQQWEVQVEDDACLVILPGPSIPYQGARYYQRARVELAPRANLIWGDIWLAGRYERGALSERFQFDRIVQDFEVRRTGRLIYRDRFRWDGPWSSHDAHWYFAGFLATASLFASGPIPDGFVAEVAGVKGSTFRLDTGATCVRWCGPPALVTAALVQTTMRLAAHWTSGPDSPPWLLESTGLSPNHWFSTPPRPQEDEAINRVISEKAETALIPLEPTSATFRSDLIRTSPEH